MTKEEFYALWNTRANNNCDGNEREIFGWWAEQDDREFWPLIEEVSKIQPKRILEIGTNHGGSTVFWDALAGPGGLVVGLDYQGFEANKMSMFRPEFGCTYVPVSDLRLLKRDSHAPETREEMASIFSEGIDFLFIDGDHSYEGVKQDFEDYSPLVRPGGLVGLHDTLMSPEENMLHCMGVSKLWRELDRPKKGFEVSFGIGLVYI